ncbi:Leukocyte elastase inhibitor [Pseudolycoriella hygida]|uniref:Leukocyte elastase inhibitor n=1 Tax=Pseudolycoriella hygida TaxID=35572 RepID=A0A9Q0NEI0_9DIPT|nr:Leukocyte elastase inhibitor [Pseudolycoriella hygida]
MKAIIILAAMLISATTSNSASDTNQDSEKDDETSRKIIGSSVVTSVSVILNGEEPPKFSDAIGKPIPRPLVPPQVASPINLLNPDRYEFYTFNDNGDLIKRLMTMKEIQSIVAGGSNEGSMLHQSLSEDKHVDGDVEDIVTSVQKVLNEEVEANRNTSSQHNVLDTPDVSSTWSIILPAIFGNTGDDIRPHKPQIVMTPDAVIVEATENPTENKVVKVKPSNIGSVNTIDDSTEKKTVEKPVTTEEPIVLITSKKPLNNAFEASTPRSSVGGYHEHSVNEIHSSHNHSFHGYRRKTTPPPEASSTESNNKVSTRFVTRRRPTTDIPRVELVSTESTNAPQFEEMTSHAPIRETTVQVVTEVKTEKATEPATELAQVVTEVATELETEKETEPATESAQMATDVETEKATETATDLLTERVALESITKATIDTISLEPLELTTYDQRYTETTTESVTESSNDFVTQVNVATTTEYSNVFDSSFNQIIESLKDDPESETVEMISQNDEIGSTTVHDVTTEFFDVEEKHSTERDLVKIPSIDVTPKINQSNVYLNEEMFVDEQEPLVYDIPTTTDLVVETTQQYEEATTNNEDVASPIFEEVKLQYPETSSIFEEKNPIVQQVDNFIHENAADIADSLAVESVNSENKVANVVSLENLTLSEFIGQAATVASILSNEADNMPIKDIVNQLVLSPQLRHEEPAVIVSTNAPASFHEMEALSMKKEEPLIPANKDNVSYETSIIKETSSISMSKNPSPEEKLPKQPEGDLIKSEVNSELFKMDSDASTEISVESDVHEVMNMVKLKMPSKVSTSVTTLSEVNDMKEEVTTFNTITEERSTERDVEASTIRFDDATVGGTTMDVEFQDEVVTTTAGNVDPTTVSENIELASKPTEHSTTPLNIASDILNTIGMVDEDLIAQKFNITFEEDESDEDGIENEEFDSLNESSTITDDITTTKTRYEQTTINRYEEEIENEIIKKLQETLEERLYPKTEKVETERTTDEHIETTTGSVPQIDISTATETVSEDEIVSTTSEDWKDFTESEQREVTTEAKIIEMTENVATMSSFETTEQANTLKDDQKTESGEEANMDQEEQISTTELTTDLYPKDEEVFVKLGETTVVPSTISPSKSEVDANTQIPIINIIPSKKHAALKIDDRTSGISQSSQHFRPHPNEQKLFFVNTAKPTLKMPPSINTLKIKVSNANRRPLPITLDPAPKQALGLEQSTLNANADILEFTKLCNELAFTFWKSLTSEGISSARSLIISPFALTSMLAMIFLGARGSTSGEMNEMLRLDDMVTFNPHLIFRNITDSVENTKDSGIANSAFVRELFSDRSKGKILSFYKDKAQQFYSGHVEEVNFNVINDIIRRRTNLLVKRHTWGKITEYIKTNNVWLNPPLAGLSANVFQTDCTKATVNERDGEMFFQVLPAIRQRRLVPIPAAVYKSGSGFMAGYDPEIDATAVAFGGTDVVSTIFVMPGQQGHSAPGDNLDRLESVFMTNALTTNAWRRLLTTLMPRQGLEVQIPRFSHRSFINATYGLQKMGLNELFNFDKADLRGLTGSTTKDMYISDMIQINTFSTCGEDKIGDQHHVELYPAPPIQQRNINYEQSLDADYADVSVSSVSDEERSLYDPLFDDQKYLELPLPLRPRQARIPEAPRLRFDKPFLYFVRHNPTGMILYMGRFNPRLLP